jgi:hypothetical protein
LVLELEVVFASIALILSVLSFRTLRAIRHLGVGRSFWIPVFAASVIFLTGSAMTILHELGFTLTAQIVEVVQVSRVLALSMLVGGVYSYSRKVRGSLREEFTIPEQVFTERLAVEPNEEDTLSSQAPTGEQKVPAKRTEKTPIQETIVECKHQLGYLQTLPKNASIPDECFGCGRIIQCKHSLTKAVEERVQTV